MSTSKSITKFQYDKSFYQDKQVLVLGGLGFMGLNLVQELISLDSAVTIVDLDSNSRKALNVPRVRRIYYADTCEKKLIDQEIHTADIIFNLAGRSGVADSFRHPLESLKANCLQYLGVLQACQEHNPNAVIVFPSSCLVYGKDSLDLAPIHPLSPYAIHKYTCEMYSRLYREAYGLSTIVLRISNPIGPYQYQVDGGYGVYNRFIYLATNGCNLTVYGEGSHVRDIVGIDSVVQAFLVCASVADMVDIVDIGCGVGMTVCDYAHLVVDTVGSGRVVHVDWPENSKGQPFTNYMADVSRVCEITDWEPNTDLTMAIVAAAGFYRWMSNNAL